MEAFLGFTVLFILGVVFRALREKAAAKKKAKAGTLVVPDNMKEKKTTVAQPETKKTKPPVTEAVQVYFHEPELRGWCCPNCECENGYSRTNCCVCNYQRK